MAVAIDGEPVLSGHLASATTHDITNKTTAGSDRVGTLDIRLTAAAFGNGEPTGVTWNGSAMTQIGTGVSNGAAGGVRSYQIVNPPTAASTIQVTCGSPSQLGYCVRSFNGAHQTTPVSGIATNSGNDTTPTVTVTSTVGSVVVNIAAANSTFSANGGGQTEDAEFTDGGNYVARCSRETGAASVVMDHTIGSAVWATQAYSIDAAGGVAAPGAFPLSRRSLHHRRRDVYRSRHV